MQTIPHFPKFLAFKLSRQDFQGTRACRRFKEDLLNYELREKKSLPLKYKKSYETARCRLQETLSPIELNHAFIATFEAKSSKLKDRQSKKLDKKFNVLKRKKGIPLLSNLDNDSNIFNYSHRVLTETEKSVLARGLRFCLPPKNVDKFEVKSSLELFFRDLKGHGPTLTAENEDRLKCQLKNISYNYIYSYDSSKQKHIVSKEELEALKDLRKDYSSIITKPDKRNGVVILNKHDYLTKMKQLISDDTKLKKLRKSDKVREQSLICYLRQLKRDHLIDEYTFQKVLPNGSTHGVLYSLYLCFAISIPLDSVCVCVCMRVCLYVCESSRPFIIYYRLCMLAPDSS